MELFTYLMAKNDHNTSVNKDLFSYLLGKNQSGTYTDYSGTSLSINNTKKGKMKVNLLGNTSQTGTPTPSSPIPVNVVSGDNTIVSTGKNLLEPKLPTYTRYGITCTNNGDGSFTLNGTATQNADFRLDQSLPSGSDNLKNYNGTYTLSCNELINGLDLRLMQDQKWTTLLAMINNNTPVTATFNKDNCFIYVNVTNGVTVNNLTIRPMLEKGSTATTYEPYTSTSYPIHLDSDELFDYAYQVEKQYNSSGTQQSSQRYTLSNNVITISRDKSNYGRYFMNKKQLTAGDYILKFTPTLSGSDNRISFSIMDLDTQVEYDEETLTITNGTEITKTFTLDTSANISINIQPYKDTSGTLTFTNVSLKSSIELCKIGDYQDRFFKNIPNTTDYNSDLEDNEWYLEKKIGKYTFTGNENMSLQNNGKRIFIRSTGTGNNIPEPLHTTSISQTFGMYCNKLVEVTAGNTWNGIQGISYDYDSNVNLGNFDISINGISTLEAYRTAVAGIILYYILQTPTYTPITGTLKDELESAWRANSYNGTTNISQVNNDLPFNLSVTALGSE